MMTRKKATEKWFGNTSRNYVNYKKSTIAVLSLRDCIKRGNYKRCGLLLNKGADCNAKQDNGKSCLHIAIAKGFKKIVKLLLHHGVNVNSTKYPSPLIAAIQARKAGICKILIDEGANVNAPSLNGNTPLHYAVEKKLPGIVNLLLQSGADVNATNYDGLRPLHLAASKNAINVLELLLSFDADVNSVDFDGYTALHFACVNGSVGSIDILLNHCANVNIMTKDSRTPFECTKPEFLARNMNEESDIYDMFERKATIATGLHILKLQAANLYLSEDTIAAVYKYKRFLFSNRMLEELSIEVAKMKSRKIKNANVTFHDLLVKNIDMLVKYFSNENVMKELKTDKCLKRFPSYSGMIKHNITRAIQRKDLLCYGFQNFPRLFPDVRLPYECIDKILSYLRDNDLILLINAFSPTRYVDPRIA